ncbi:MAG: cytochrome c4 [Neisseriaceae bacterium]|nr:cytochrome c4 [Neisseriaceae bacterium]
MKRFLPALVITLFATNVFAAPDLENGKQIAENVCAACHAADGNSPISIYPRLAGQHAAYTAEHVKYIRDGSRAWGDMVITMVPNVEGMSDQEIEDVSAYYALQVSLTGEADADPEKLKAGQDIYRGGILAQKVPACMACHGPNGAGIPAASVAKDGVLAYPRISGQHKDYVVAQMQAFRDGSRQHGMMSTIGNRMTDQQIDDVANYIQGLH